jgi:Zn-dependent protease/predicted transcriptional regulator
MGWSITLGRVAGTAIRIHLTFLLLLLWIAISAYSRGGTSAAVSNTLFIVLLFACVLLHEFGHIFMARAFGIPTPDVTLLPIGGVAMLQRLPDKPVEQLLVAVAGPAVNVVIAVILIMFLGATTDSQTLAKGLTRIDDPQISMVAKLAAANIFLVLFNMIPAFPMDGGRVLNALLAMRMGKQRAIQISARIGQALAIAFGFLGLFGSPLLIFIAIFIYMAASAEAQASEIEDVTSGLTISDAMETSFVTMPADASLEDAIDTLLATSQVEFPVVDYTGKAMGILTRDALIAALSQNPRSEGVMIAVQPACSTLHPGEPLARGLEELNRLGASAITVIGRDGKVSGMLTRQNIAEMLMIHAVKPEWKFARR